jgi:hypothetical protein
MIGIGTPSSHNRIPRPISASNVILCVNIGQSSRVPRKPTRPACSRVECVRCTSRPGATHLAELDRAFLAVGAWRALQRERAALVLAVLDIDRLGAVENDGQLRSLRGDLEGVPFAGRFRHRIDLGDVDNPSGAIARVGALVEDVHLVGIVGRDFLRIGTADEDAAIGLVVGPELDYGDRALVLVPADAIGRPRSASLSDTYGVRGQRRSS